MNHTLRDLHLHPTNRPCSSFGRSPQHLTSTPLHRSLRHFLDQRSNSGRKTHPLDQSPDRVSNLLHSLLPPALPLPAFARRHVSPCCSALRMLSGRDGDSGLLGEAPCHAVAVLRGLLLCILGPTDLCALRLVLFQRIHGITREHVALTLSTEITPAKNRPTTGMRRQVFSQRSMPNSHGRPDTFVTPDTRTPRSSSGPNSGEGYLPEVNKHAEERKEKQEAHHRAPTIARSPPVRRRLRRRRLPSHRTCPGELRTQILTSHSKVDKAC